MMAPLLQVFLFLLWLNPLIQHLPHDVACRYATQLPIIFTFPSRLTVKHLFREVRLEYLLAFRTLHSTF
jgi:hypothetical protein